MLLENKDKFKKKLKEKTGLGIYVPNIRQLIWNSEFLMERFNGRKSFLQIICDLMKMQLTFLSLLCINYSTVHLKVSQNQSRRSKLRYRFPYSVPTYKFSLKSCACVKSILQAHHDMAYQSHLAARFSNYKYYMAPVFKGWKWRNKNRSQND